MKTTIILQKQEPEAAAIRTLAEYANISCQAVMFEAFQLGLEILSDRPDFLIETPTDPTRPAHIMANVNKTLPVASVG